MLASLLVGLMLVLTLFSVQQVSAQDQRCFPETNQCISGPIRTYWEQRGGLPIFGFPITPQRLETVEGRQLQVQWFERDRLEIQADGTVTTGRLGVELLALQGRPWQPGNKISPDAGCLANFPTGHQICGAFAKFWNENGGLVRLGYPVTGEMQETIEGQTYTVQYFERRRFELHGSQVMLGLLGREVLNFTPATPSPTQTPLPPTDLCDQVPASVSAFVNPHCGPAGTIFSSYGMGFTPGEWVGVYLTAPDQSVIGAPFQVRAERDGTTSGVTFRTQANFPTGIYVFTFEGVDSHHKGFAYFGLK
ncbi:hypothetical protein OSCT_1906 [Oscillochloris trichoides DG-6]|uniref:MORN repeat-containing protein n=1 Tax=Oscillochloris trichoides DG-6 TaxID=765420 RepID=E1IF05_9CHLR|nr:hypothetical protein OSCT_1906 [Oscillochloris trichoides DG-6]